MSVEDVLKLANAKLELDDLLEAKRILTEGYGKYNNQQLLDMLNKVQSLTKHLENLESYRDYYEIKQARGETTNILKLLERKFRSWTGKRTRKLQYRGGRVYLDSQKRFISDKLSVHIATCF